MGALSKGWLVKQKGLQAAEAQRRFSQVGAEGWRLPPVRVQML